MRSSLHFGPPLTSGKGKTTRKDLILQTTLCAAADDNGIGHMLGDHDLGVDRVLAIL